MDTLIERAKKILLKELWDDWYWPFEVVATIENEIEQERPIALTMAATQSLLAEGLAKVARARFVFEGAAFHAKFDEVSSAEVSFFLNDPEVWRYGSERYLLIGITTEPLWRKNISQADTKAAPD